MTTIDPEDSREARRVPHQARGVPACGRRRRREVTVKSRRRQACYAPPSSRWIACRCAVRRRLFFCAVSLGSQRRPRLLFRARHRSARVGRRRLRHCAHDLSPDPRHRGIPGRHRHDRVADRRAVPHARAHRRRPGTQFSPDGRHIIYETGAAGPRLRESSRATATRTRWRSCRVPNRVLARRKQIAYLKLTPTPTILQALEAAIAAPQSERTQRTAALNAAVAKESRVTVRNLVGTETESPRAICRRPRWRSVPAARSFSRAAATGRDFTDLLWPRPGATAPTSDTGERSRWATVTRRDRRRFSTVSAGGGRGGRGGAGRRTCRCRCGCTCRCRCMG